MSDDTARRDPNRVPSLIGVDDVTYKDTVTAAISSSHEQLVKLTAITATVPLPTGAATSAKQDTALTQLQIINSLTPGIYDYISLSYTGSNLTSVVFKTGGSGGTTISTLTLAYDGSDNLTSVTKS